MIKACLPKVGIILFLVSLLFVAVINPHSVFKYSILQDEDTGNEFY